MFRTVYGEDYGTVTGFGIVDGDVLTFDRPIGKDGIPVT